MVGGGTIRENQKPSTLPRIDLQSDFLGIEKRRWVLADENSIQFKMSQQGIAWGTL